MLRIMSMIALIIFAGLLFTGCSSIPQHPNLTGTWKYNIIDSISKEKNDGQMKLTQDVYEVKGSANDAHGEFTVNGTVTGPEFTLKFVKNDKSLEYTVNVEMTSNDAFAGTFTNTKGKAGMIEFFRK